MAVGYMLERDSEVANTRIFVGHSKTAAGLREIRTLPILHDILATHKARPAAGGPDRRRPARSVRRQDLNEIPG